MWRKDVIESLIVKGDDEAPHEFDDVESMTGQALLRDFFDVLHSKSARKHAREVRKILCPLISSSSSPLA